MMKELQIPHIFAHADEQVYAKPVHIIWKNPVMYKGVIVLMGGFHQMRVILYKRYGFLGFRQWFVDAGVIRGGGFCRYGS